MNEPIEFVVRVDSPGEVEALSVRDGDVLIWRNAGAGEELAFGLSKWLHERGLLHCIVVMLPPGDDLSKLDPAAMAAQGWTRLDSVAPQG